MSDPTAAASREALWGLWHSLLNTLTAYLEHTPPLEQTAAMLAIVRAFLRDNGIAADASAAKDLLSSMKELGELNLPFH